MRDIVIVVLAIGAVFLAKIYWFDDIEKIAWDYFWGSLKEGNITIKDMKGVTHTSTFFKSLLSFVAGGLIGIILTRLFKIK